MTGSASSDSSARRITAQTYDGGGDSRGASFVCAIGFTDATEELQLQLRTAFREALEKIRPRAEIKLDGTILLIRGRGEDDRCSFCRYFRSAATSRGAVVRCSCRFEDRTQEKPPKAKVRAGAVIGQKQQLLGRRVTLKDLDTSEVNVKTIGRESDLDNGVLSIETQIVQGLIRVGGVHAESGAVIEVNGHPMYEVMKVE